MGAQNYYDTPPQENTRSLRLTDNRLARQVLFYAFCYAQQSKTAVGRHCAVILNGSWENIVSISINDRSLHAEVGAIQKIPPNVDIDDCFMVVVRSTIPGKMTMSMPCRNCVNALKRYGIKTCIYSNGHFKFTRLNI